MSTAQHAMTIRLPATLAEQDLREHARRHDTSPERP